MSTLERVYNHDLAYSRQFDPTTRRYFPEILFWLANSEKQSLNKMAQRLNIHTRTIHNIFAALISSEILSAIPALGASSGKVAKPYKHIFVVPAIRQALSNAKPKSEQWNKLRGHLLEDTIGFYLKQMISDNPFGGLIEYDASRAGADFVVMPQYMKDQSIPIEVGWGKKDDRQIQNTLKRTRSNYYGLVIADCSLAHKNNNRTVFVPLRTFLLAQPSGWGLD